MNKRIRVNRVIDGDEWAVNQVYEDGIGSLYYTKNGDLMCTATIDEPLSFDECEKNLIKFILEQDPITQACKAIIEEDRLHKRLIEKIVNSKSKIKTPNFQGENSLQAYLNGKAQREQEIINIINEVFCEDDK